MSKKKAKSSGKKDGKNHKKNKSKLSKPGKKSASSKNKTSNKKSDKKANKAKSPKAKVKPAKQIRPASKARPVKKSSAKPAKKTAPKKIAKKATPKKAAPKKATKKIVKPAPKKVAKPVPVKKAKPVAVKPAPKKAEISKPVKETPKKTEAPKAQESLKKVKAKTITTTVVTKEPPKPLFIDKTLDKPMKEPAGKFELEYVIRTSPSILFEFLTSPSGLSEWFCDDVNIRNEIYTFLWEGAQQQARLIKFYEEKLVRFQWVERTDDAYFEFRIDRDDLTNDISLIVTDFADNESEKQSSKLLWDGQIERLLRVLGSNF